MRSLISIQDVTPSDILFLLKQAEKIKKGRAKQLLQGTLMASCFFEPSTRTRLSFEAAMLRQGGQVTGFAEGHATSSAKGETLYDAMKVIGSYVDVIVLRHPLDGAARLASTATDTPIINAGDGVNQHPTQALVDLFTIQECQGKLKGLHIAFAGDLTYGRTVHSLSMACAHFDMRLFFISSDALQLPTETCHVLRKRGVKFSFHHTVEEVIGKVDILYMTRIQKERVCEANKENLCKVSPSMLQKAKKNLKILHPLPRVDEIDRSLDATPFAYYFTQAENGIYVRQALLAYVLGKL